VRLAVVLAVAVIVLAPSVSGAAKAPKRVPQVIVETDVSFDDIAALAYLGEAHKDGLIKLRAVIVSSNGVGLRGHARANVECLFYTKLGLSPAEVPITDDDPPPEGREAPNKFPAFLQALNDEDVHFALENARGPDCEHTAGETAPQYQDEVKDVDDAVQLLRDSILGSLAPVRLITLGAMTTVDVGLEDSRVVERIRDVFTMGGSTVGGTLFPAPETEGFDGSQEFNFWLDPPAIQRVIALVDGPRTPKMTIVPIDATNFVPLIEAFRLRLADDRTTAAADVVYYLAVRLAAGEGPPPFLFWWDPLAVVSSMFPGVVEFEDKRVRVVTADENQDPDLSNVGELIVDDTNGTEVRLGTSADPDRFHDIFIDMLNSRLG